MLKKVNLSIAAIALSVASIAPAQASVEEALANICTIVQADDKGELRKKIRSVQKDYNLKLHDFYSGVSCAGQSLIRTAITNGAVEVGALMVKKMPKKALSAAEADGQTLQAWIEANGHSASPIAQQLSARI